MALDSATKRQLVEARQNIIAQLDQLEFRVTSKSGGWRRRGPQDRGDVYDVLQNELRQIDALLASDTEDEV